MKNLKRIITVFGILLFVTGMIVLFQATNIGTSFALKEMQANGGSMDTSQYYFIKESYTLSVQLGATVLAIVGGIGAIVFGSRSIE